MRIKNFDISNFWEFWEYITRPSVDREIGETDEHYRNKILKYMKECEDECNPYYKRENNNER